MAKRSSFFPELLSWLRWLLIAVPLLLVAWFVPDGLDLLGFSASSSARRKPWSAEAKFFLAAFFLLLAMGAISWLVWRYALNH